MYGFIYITENLINGKRYLGFCGYQKKIWTSYLGSGKQIKQAIKKYGKHNFKRTIIQEAETKEELSQKEIEYITQFNCVESREWYNIAEGGYTTRGFAGRKHSEKTREKMRKNHKQPLTEDSKRRIGEAMSKRMKAKPNLNFYGKTGKNHNRSIPITVDGVTYETLTAASLATGLSYFKLRVSTAHSKIDA